MARLIILAAVVAGAVLVRRLVSFGVTVFVVAVALALTSGSAASHTLVSKRTGTIAFVRQASDKVYGGPLFVIRPDGSGLRRLTPETTRVYSYGWSPDSRWIAYIDQRLSLWLVRPNATGRRRLLPGSRLDSVALSWSPDGTRIAIASPGSNLNPQRAPCNTTLYVVRIASGQPTALPAKTDDCDVAWSPRGDEIAYNNDGIFVIQADGTGRRRVTPPGKGFNPQWSADGTQLAFRLVIHAPNGDTDRYHAYGIVNADGTNFHLLTTHAYNEYGAAWSPHGHQILYGTADRGIYAINSDRSNNHRVTPDTPPQALWGALAWSPTGNSIVYTTATDGTYNTDLYIIGINGSAKTQLTNTPDIDIAPTWVAR